MNGEPSATSAGDTDGDLRAFTYLPGGGSGSDDMRHGRLAGLRVAVKDNIAVRGMPTTNGSRWHDRRMARHDATVVERLRIAGATIAGKCNMDEFGLGGFGLNSAFGACRNPHDHERVSGGSSSGAAVAVAAEVVDAALGTDTGGSIRTPCAYTGVVGLRPTVGALPMDGITPTAPTLDTVGPIATTVERVRDLFHVMATPVGGAAQGPANLVAGSLQTRTVGVPVDLIEGNTSDEVLQQFHGALAVLQELGASLHSITFANYHRVWQATRDVIAREAYLQHARALAIRPRKLNAATRARILEGAGLTHLDHRDAMATRTRWRSELRAFWAVFDAIALPTKSTVAPRLDDAGNSVDAATLTLFTHPWSLAGAPALTVPCGLAKSGMPAGLQFVGRPRGEDDLFAIAATYEANTSTGSPPPVSPTVQLSPMTLPQEQQT